jgi:rhamnosyltransferase
MRTALIVPTLNAGSLWTKWLERLDLQTWKPDRVVVLDSESEDGTAELARRSGHDVHVLEREHFDHGGTRQIGVDLCPEAEVLIFMTQDAVLATEDSLAILMKSFREPRVAASFGRQLPREEARATEAFSRIFSYPHASQRKTWEDRHRLRIRTTFISNSFAAYRCEALAEVNGFPPENLICEDVVVAARMLMQGWEIMYVAEAEVFHSHDYGASEEFRRYFDIGAFHSLQHWILDEFGLAEGEGWRYFRAELDYIAQKEPWLLPYVGIRTAAKFLGYQLGYRQAILPKAICRALSMHPPYWRNRKSAG